MRVIGIDPGYAIVGYGVLEYEKGKFYPVEYGAVTTDAHTDFQMRIKEIFLEVDRIIKRTRPEALAIEKLFYTTNQKTVMQVAQARGVILLAASLNDLPVYEYTPLQVKQSVVGYGRAEKQQVIQMVTTMLGLPKPPKPDDTADALAIAMCHGNCAYSRIAKYYNT